MKGARIGIGPKGAYTSAGIPGTGLYSINYLSKKNTGTREGPVSSQPQAGLPIPSELQLPALSSALIISSIVLLFVKPFLGILGVAGYIVWMLGSPLKVPRKHFSEGNISLKKGDTGAALKSFNFVLDFNPDIASLFPVMARLHFSLEQFEESANYYSKHLQNHPSDNISQFYYALALIATGSPEEGIKILQGLPEELRKDVGVITALGTAFLEIKKPELAVEALEKGPTRKKSMDSQMLNFRYVLGVAYKENKQTKKAISQLRKVYTEDMDFMDVKELLEELETTTEG